VKPKQLLIKDETYNFHWLVIFGCSYQEAVNIYAKRIGVTPWEASSTHKQHQANFTNHPAHRVSLIWFDQKKPPPSVIAHECLHAIIYFAEKLVVPINEKTEEVFTYYLDMLIERIYESCKS